MQPLRLFVFKNRTTEQPLRTQGARWKRAQAVHMTWALNDAGTRLLPAQGGPLLVAKSLNCPQQRRLLDAPRTRPLGFPLGPGLSEALELHAETNGT